MGTRNQNSVRELFAKYKNEELDLSPSFQRKHVWGRAARSLLIDTVLRDMPLPLVLLRDTSEGLKSSSEVVDGQQRLTTLFEFISPGTVDAAAFELTPAHEKVHGAKTFEGLSGAKRDQIFNYILLVHTLSRTTSDATVLDIFSRLNSTGLKLNAQEIRNAEFVGHYRQYINRMCEEIYPVWSELKVISDAELLRMKDREFVSDVTNFLMKGIRPSTDEELSSLYKEFDEKPFVLEVDARERISATLQDLVKQYKLIRLKSRLRGKGWFYTVFAHAYWQKYGCLLGDQANEARLSDAWEGVDERLDAVLQDDEFEDIRKSARTTNLKTRRQKSLALGRALYGSNWMPSQFI